MKKEITIDSLRKIVNESVTNVLKEYHATEMPGLSKNPKVKAAQYNAHIKPIGARKPDGSFSAHWEKNGNGVNNAVKINGGRTDCETNSIYNLLTTIKYGSDKEIEAAGKQLGKMLHNDNDLLDKVQNALSDEMFKHCKDVAKWNPEY